MSTDNEEPRRRSARNPTPSAKAQDKQPANGEIIAATEKPTKNAKRTTAAGGEDGSDASRKNATYGDALLEMMHRLMEQVEELKREGKEQRTAIQRLQAAVQELRRMLPSFFLALISFSTADLTVPAVTLLFSVPASIVQNRVSVNAEGIVFVEGSVRTLSAWFVGGVRASSAYDARGLDPANAIPGQFLMSCSCSWTSFLQLPFRFQKLSLGLSVLSLGSLGSGAEPPCSVADF
jgi:hypothetical protein